MSTEQEYVQKKLEQFPIGCFITYDGQVGRVMKYVRNPYGILNGMIECYMVFNETQHYLYSDPKLKFHKANP